MRCCITDGWQQFCCMVFFSQSIVWAVTHVIAVSLVSNYEMHWRRYRNNCLYNNWHIKPWHASINKSYMSFQYLLLWQLFTCCCWVWVDTSVFSFLDWTVHLWHLPCSTDSSLWCASYRKCVMTVVTPLTLPELTPFLRHFRTAAPHLHFSLQHRLLHKTHHNWHVEMSYMFPADHHSETSLVPWKWDYPIWFYIQLTCCNEHMWWHNTNPG